MSKRTLAIVLTGVTAACWPAGAQGRPSGTCATRGATVAATAKARVFRQGRSPKGDAGTKLYYGCLLGSHRIVRLNRSGGFGLGAVLTRTLALAGRYVAFDSAVPTGAADDSDVVVLDLRTGKTARWAPVGAPDGQAAEDPRVQRLVLTARGTVAWIVDDCVHATPAECRLPLQTEHVLAISDGPVAANRFGAPRALARSAAISPGSLALSASSATVYWMDGAVAHAAAIH